MKHALPGLVLLAIFFTLAMSAPFEKGHGVLHRQSPHRGLSRRLLAAHGKQPPKLNLSFTPVISGDVFVYHVRYEASTQLQTSDFRFSATLSKLRHDDDVVDAGHPSGRDSQVALDSVDTYGGHPVVISAPDPVVWALGKRGVSQDAIPQYVYQNVHVADPRTGDQYRLVPDSNSRVPMSIDSRTVMIALSMND